MADERPCGGEHRRSWFDEPCAGWRCECGKWLGRDLKVGSGEWTPSDTPSRVWLSPRRTMIDDGRVVEILPTVTLTDE